MQFKSRYLIAISLVIGLLVVNQVTIQYWLQEKSADAGIINISGKQRMLSQKIFGLVQFYKSNPTNDDIREEIYDSFAEWKRVHNLLLKRDNRTEKELSANILARLDKLTFNIDFVENVLKDIEVFSNMESLHINQMTFLKQMNEIVNLLEEDSNRKLATIVRVELILAFITLIVIFLEIQLIFRPMILELRNRNKELKDKNSVLEEYAYIAAHGLRSPIQNLLNFLGLFKRSAAAKIDDKEKYYLEFVEASAQRMNNTTSDLLHYAEAGTVKPEKIDIEQVIKEQLKTLSNVIEEKNAIVKVRDLPKVSLIDKNLFGLLFQNLIANSLKFVPDERQPKIEVWSQSDKEFQFFHLKDNGIGIAKEAHEKVFKIFQRLHNQEKYQGTGIGLALCKRIVEEHGGDIWIDPIREGNGSHFIFKIPKP